MKLPRGVSGERVIQALERLGYEIIRQKGSHVMLRHDGPRSTRSRCPCTTR
ncbi:MAG: type II toxin-antitoxin system HicA family toxin [Bryobacteraceae bacterium]